MATNAVLVKTGTQHVFADHATDFTGGTAKTSMEVSAGASDVQIDCTSLADTAGRESAKLDLGAVRAPRYSFMAAIEFAATPTVGEVVEFYWAPSPISTAANGNPNEIDGADAAAPSGIGTLAELVKMCQFIGAMVVTNDTTGSVQTAIVNSAFVPAERYGILIVKNESGAAFHSAMAETHYSLTEIIDDIAAAA